MKKFKVCDKIVVEESIILLDGTISTADLEKIQLLDVDATCYISFGLTKNAKITRIQ